MSAGRVIALFEMNNNQDAIGVGAECQVTPIRYLKPAPSDEALEVRAQVTDVKDKRKFTLKCAVYSGAKADGGEKVVDAEVIAFLVFSSDKPDHGDSPFGG